MGRLDTLKSFFNKPKLAEAIKVEGRNIFYPRSYYFALYEDGSYSLYDGDTYRYLDGIKRFDFATIIKETKRVARFNNPGEIGKEYDLFYKAINKSDSQDEYIAKEIANNLNIKPWLLKQMYYYHSGNSRTEYIWDNYKKIRELFVDRCKKLGIQYENDSNIIINQAIGKINTKENENTVTKDLLYCKSLESIKAYFAEKEENAKTERDFAKLESKFSYDKSYLTEYTSSFFDLSNKAIIALKNSKKEDTELLKKYTEFLISLPSYCQLLLEMEKCSELASEKKQSIKTERLNANQEFIQNINELIDHDPEQEIYHYHLAAGKYEANRILEEGLYTYSDRISSFEYPELSLDDILKHKYGNDFSSLEDYIIVFAEPKNEIITRKLTEEERKEVKIVPRRPGLVSEKPTYVVDQKYIVGYIDKVNCQVVTNKKFYNYRDTAEVKI